MGSIYRTAERSNSSLAEVGEERRGGYSWYSDEGNEVLEKYIEWEKAIQ